MVFYARTFAATSPNCLGPGCAFESGAKAGICSEEVGALMNSEILEMMEDRNINSTLDKEAAGKDTRL